MAKRRRRRRGTWFPNLGTAGSPGDPDDDDYGRFFRIVADNNAGTSNTIILDLTFDQPEEDEALSGGVNRSTLADIIGSEYILRRIVGNFFCASDLNNNAETGSFATMVTAGFFVARAEDSSTEAADISLPIGTETAVETRENYSPAQGSTIREPWIWRRRWILGNSVRFNGASAEGVTQFPPTNTTFQPGVMNGPFIDARTVRRVSQDDRLWFACSVRQLGPLWDTPFINDGVAQNVNVNCHLDYRLFGHLTKARNRGTF